MAKLTIMDNDITLNSPTCTKQAEYIRSHKEELFGEYSELRLPFVLNTPVYFNGILCFELLKKFGGIAKEMDSDRLIHQELDDILDRTVVRDGDDYWLMESMKLEAKIAVFTNYVHSISSKKMYPSQVKRKEKALLNAVERAQKKIEDFFKSGDVKYSEISDVIDIFEIIITDNGNHVDLHFGRGGFTLDGKNNSLTLLEYAANQRIAMKEKREVADKYITEIDSLKNRAETLQNNVTIEFNSAISELRFSDFSLWNKSVETLIEEFEDYKRDMLQLIVFLGKLSSSGIQLSSKFTVDLQHRTLQNSYFNFYYRNKTAEQFVEEYANYNKAEPFIASVAGYLNANELRAKATFSDNRLYIKASVRRKIQITMQEFANRLPYREATITLSCVDGKLFRETGEEVLTPEVIQFEMMERMRTVEKDYLISMERAKEMFISVLSENEEKLYLEKDIAILEGEENYYAIVGTESYNNVVKIPKTISNIEEMRALCIHPADPSVPMYDGFAAIALSIKSGDEQYVLDNSNQFSASEKIKKKIMEALGGFIPEKQLQLA